MASNDMNVEKALFLQQMLEKGEINCSFICGASEWMPPSASQADYPEMQFSYFYVPVLSSFLLTKQKVTSHTCEHANDCQRHTFYLAFTVLFYTILQCVLSRRQSYRSSHKHRLLVVLPFPRNMQWILPCLL